MSHHPSYCHWKNIVGKIITIALEENIVYAFKLILLAPGLDHRTSVTTMMETFGNQSQANWYEVMRSYKSRWHLAKDWQEQPFEYDGQIDALRYLHSSSLIYLRLAENDQQVNIGFFFSSVCERMAERDYCHFFLG